MFGRSKRNLRYSLVESHFCYFISILGFLPDKTHSYTITDSLQSLLPFKYFDVPIASRDHACS